MADARVKTIAAVTAGRSDFSIYLPILRRILEEPRLALRLFATGMHLSARFGLTVRAIEAEGFSIAERIETLGETDTPEAIAKSIAQGTAGFAQAFARSRPDMLLVLGDRYEMYAAVLAALPFTIPVAHIHGGELTEGAIDDALRHSITKLSHLHFVATDEYARRVRQMGEEAWRITVCGAPALDNLRSFRAMNAAELEAAFSIRLTPKTLVVTFHPTTLEYEQAAWQINELLSALKASGYPILFTMPNADTGGLVIRSAIEDYIRQEPNAAAAESLGTNGYFSVLSLCAAMVGNSSSGILESPSFHLPVVNVGTRQQGRVRAVNVIDVGYGRHAILAGMRRALSPAFRRSLDDVANPYGEGRAAPCIVERLAEIELGPRVLKKRFQDLPAFRLE
jgi:UDP-hydrolysing UDP-N-acetyl-D-glucosamine 2-epimerase